MINFKSFTKLIVLFIITFSIFVASSIAIYHTTESIETASTDYDNTHGSTISADNVHLILANYVSAFQIIFFILSIGIGFAIIISLITGRREYEDYE